MSTPWYVHPLGRLALKMVVIVGMIVRICQMLKLEEINENIDHDDDEIVPEEQILDESIIGEDITRTEVKSGVRRMCSIKSCLRRNSNRCFSQNAE